MHNKFVLIASDDNVSMRDLEQRISSIGCRVATIPREHLTASTVNSLSPSVLILDMDRWGSATCEHLSWQEKLCACQSYPVLALSARPVQAYASSTNLKWLQKPVSIEHIRHHLLRSDSTLISTVDAHCPASGSNCLDDIWALIQERCGFGTNGRGMKGLEHALVQRMSVLGISDYAGYLKLLGSSPENIELASLIDILTVGETSFFRYQAQDEILINSILPEIILRKRKEKTLDIWSAGCASGEEPYTLALMIKKYFPQLQRWNLRLLATDINQRFLGRAREGSYSARNMRNVPQDLRDKHFTSTHDRYTLSESVRQMVTFEYFNLHNGSFPVRDGCFDGYDVILCRNVLIYFEAASKKTVVEKLTDCLNPLGYMLFGHSEMMQTVSSRLKPVHNGQTYYYQLKNCVVTH